MRKKAIWPDRNTTNDSIYHHNCCLWVSRDLERVNLSVSQRVGRDMLPIRWRKMRNRYGWKKIKIRMTNLWCWTESGRIDPFCFCCFRIVRITAKRLSICNGKSGIKIRPAQEGVWAEPGRSGPVWSGQLNSTVAGEKRLFIEQMCTSPTSPFPRSNPKLTRRFFLPSDSVVLSDHYSSARCFEGYIQVFIPSRPFCLCQVRL
jgi:hypothetical protein